MFHPILLLLGFWYVLPAYVANGFAVFGKFIKSRHPIDGNHTLGDGQLVLGPGKTWEGFVIGLISGVLIGFLQIIGAPFLLALILMYLYLPVEFVPVVLVNVPLVILVALGALVGDLIGSFIKRRLKINRGRPAPILDQLDFLIMAILLGAFITPIPWVLAVFLLIVTPLIHLCANVIGYLLRLKQEPW
ncbi:MAG: CDP-2,3-bis-(O-geranylgeranyl)-sn-glycerol synthase [Candidatus Thorarchaeota archaeon]